MSIYIYVHISLSIYIFIYLLPQFKNLVRNVSVATDEGLSPKLAPSEGGSRGNIES